MQHVGGFRSVFGSLSSDVMMVRSERVWFSGAFGDKLAGRLDLPDAPPRALGIFAHCFTCSKDYKAIHRICCALAERGLGVLRFDFTGLGESGGDFAQATFASHVADLLAAVDWLAANQAPPSFLVGHSLGGAAVLAAAGRVATCRAVATIAAPSEPAHLADTLDAMNPTVRTAGEGEVTIGGQRFRIRRELLEDLKQHELRDAIAALGRPLLVLHSPADETTSIDHARRIFEAARHPKSFVSLHEADHLLVRDPRDAVFVAGVIGAFVDRYAAEPAPESP